MIEFIRPIFWLSVDIVDAEYAAEWLLKGRIRVMRSADFSRAERRTRKKASLAE